MTQMLEWAEKNFKLLYSHYKDVQGSKRKNIHNKETDEESKLRNIINGNKIKILELLKILMFYDAWNEKFTGCAQRRKEWSVTNEYKLFKPENRKDI